MVVVKRKTRLNFNLKEKSVVSPSGGHDGAGGDVGGGHGGLDVRGGQGHTVGGGDGHGGEGHLVGGDGIDLLLLHLVLSLALPQLGDEGSGVDHLLELGVLL